ncbi:MAG: L-aspartate oxidase [Pseudomonadota bacterium]
MGGERLLIVGAGVTGLRAALASPAPVTLLTGSVLGDGTSTGWAQGGVAAALGADDSPALHAADTIRAGAGLVNEAAARVLAEEGPAEVEALHALGAPFERGEDGRWLLSREAAHGRARVARVKGDQAGAGMLAALIRAVRDADHITILNGWRVRALVPDENGGCAGVLAERPDGVLQTLEASATLLTTGSLCGLYAVTTTPWTSQGQALAMAAQLGAVIQDAEFIQFHPTAIDVGRDPAPLATEALRGEGATLLDRQGLRFMTGVHADSELAPRDVVARAVHRQVQSGRGAFLDARTAVGAAFPDRFPSVFAACRAAGIDPRIQPIPVAPAAHYHMGGVATDLDGFTGVEGLYAAGECASNGLHGANRLASNSLLEGLVFGRRAAQAAAGALDRNARPAAARPLGDLAGPPLQRLREAMSAHAGVERDQAGLVRLIEIIDRLEARCGPRAALTAARFVAAGALERTESRGGHFRRDFPKSSDTAEHSRMTAEQAYAVSAPNTASLEAAQ